MKLISGKFDILKVLKVKKEGRDEVVVIITELEKPQQYLKTFKLYNQNSYIIKLLDQINLILKVHCSENNKNNKVIPHIFEMII